MTKVTRKGRVAAYDSAAGKMICNGDPSVYFWIGTKVRTKGTKKSTCKPSTKTFDVTVTADIADKLVPGFEFDVEYVEDEPSSVKTVTKFAGTAVVAS